MRRTAIASATTLLLAFGGQPLQAQSLFYGTQCAFGAFQACASVELWNETDAATGQLYMFVRLANMQGTRNLEHLGPNALATVILNDLTVEDPTPELAPMGYDIASRTQAFSGFGQLSGNTYLCTSFECLANSSFVVGEYWDALVTNDRPGPGLDGDEVRLRNDIIFDSGNPLWGCSPPNQSGYGGPATCDGWATWRIHMGYGAGFRLTNDVAVNLQFISFDEAGNEVRTGCDIGVDCVTVTPEPGTIALVATGLAALGAARRRRKSRQYGEPTDS